MELIKSLNQVIAFVLELCLLVSLGYWGFQVRPEILLKIVLGIGLPIGAAVLWGAFLAPHAPHRLEGFGLAGLKLALFGLGSLVLYHAQHPVLAISLFVVAVISITLASILE